MSTRLNVVGLNLGGKIQVQQDFGVSEPSRELTFPCLLDWLSCQQDLLKAVTFVNKF